MELKKLMVDSKSVWMDFPGLEGFSVEVANLSRKELMSLRKKCTSQNHQRPKRVVRQPYRLQDRSQSMKRSKEYVHD